MAADDNDQRISVLLPVLRPIIKEISDKHRFNGQLYSALVRGEEDLVINLCQEAPDKALHILTPHNDTVLHIATSSRQESLLRRLLEQCLPDDFHGKISRRNHLGNTILHELAISKQGVLMARIMLEKAPELLAMRNNLGETALFRAAACGRSLLFDFFHEQIQDDDQASRQVFLQRNDGSTVLHISIINQLFDLALSIAGRNQHLIGERDVNGMTALQLLSCNPPAFRRRKDGFLKRHISSGFLQWLINANQTAYYKEKQRDDSAALELAKFLIERDTPWEATNDVMSPAGQGGGEGKTPLFLATKSGCVEIVQEILKLYPLAVEYIDDNEQNILHLAIKYRRFRIFKLLTTMELPMTRLVRQVDKEGNSILHMAGIKMKHYVPRKMLTDPAAELGKELGWFERVKKVTPPYFINHQNHMKQTANELFASTNSELCDSAKEWLKRASEGCSIVAVLIATVAFAAAYTIPGGANQITGRPLLIYHPFFVVFIVTDVLSVTLALKAVLSFLSILTSPFHIEDFKQPLPRKFALGVACLFQSVAMMILAFAATISLMIHNKERWIKIALCTIAFLPIGMVARSHFHIYYSLLLRTFKYVHKKARCAFRWSEMQRNRVRVLYEFNSIECLGQEQTNINSFERLQERTNTEVLPFGMRTYRPPPTAGFSIWEANWWYASSEHIYYGHLQEFSMVRDQTEAYTLSY